VRIALSLLILTSIWKMEAREEGELNQEPEKIV
jgi:hypothetical protein